MLVQTADARVILHKEARDIQTGLLTAGSTFLYTDASDALGRGAIRSVAFKTNAYNYGGYELGETLDQDDDFFLKFNFTGGVGGNGFSCSSGTCWFKVGMWKHSDQLINNSIAIFLTSNHSFGSHVYDSSGTETAGTVSGTISDGNPSVATLSYNSATGIITTILYQGDGTTQIANATQNITGSTFSVDRIGTFVYRSSNGNDNYWYINQVHANTGTSDNTTLTRYNPQSGYLINSTEGGNDATLYPHVDPTGLVDINIYNSTSGALVARLETNNSEAAGTNITLPTFTTDINVTDGKSVLTKSGSYPSEVKNVEIAVLQTDGNPYICPSATTLGDISESCSGKVATPTARAYVYDSRVYYLLDADNGGMGNADPGNQTVYISKINTQLNESALYSGQTSNNYKYVTSYGGSIITLAQRYSSYWYYGFDINTNLTQNDDFFARFKWRRSGQWTCSSGTCYSKYGLWNHTGQVNSNTLDVSVATNSRMYAYFKNATGGTSSEDNGENWNPSADTYYISTLVHDAATDSIIAKIYLESTGVLQAIAVLDISGQSFGVNRIGVFPLRTGSANDNFWYLTEVHLNEGVGQGGFPIKIASESGYTFNTTGGTDVTTTGQNGTQTINAFNTTAGKAVGQFVINFDQSVTDIDLPTITSAVDAVEGKAIFHNTSAYPAAVSSWYLLVPKTDERGYHCPDATTLDDINTSCPGIEFGAYATVNIDGTDYWKMPNQGGGNAPSSIKDNQTFNVTTDNTDPIISNTICYDSTTGSSVTITPTAFSTSTVICNATVYDKNGCQDYNTTTPLGEMYYLVGQPCGADNHTDCYNNASCEWKGTCSGLTNQTVECSFDVQFAAANDTSSNWQAFLNITDGTAWDNDTANMTMATLATLNLQEASIDLGTITPGTNLTNTNVSLTIENGGNVELDLDLNGTSTFVCPTGPNIPIAYLKWNYSSSNLYGSSTGLTTTVGSPTAGAFDLTEDQSIAAASTNTSDVLYWGMGVPYGVIGGQTCVATIRVGAVQG